MSVAFQHIEGFVTRDCCWRLRARVTDSVTRYSHSHHPGKRSGVHPRGNRPPRYAAAGDISSRTLSSGSVRHYSLSVCTANRFGLVLSLGTMVPRQADGTDLEWGITCSGDQIWPGAAPNPLRAKAASCAAMDLTGASYRLENRHNLLCR